MEKYKRIFDTLRLVYNKFNEEDIVGVFLYGSQNYNLDRKNSDIDVKVITLPSLDTIAKGANPYSKEKEIFDKDEIALGKMDIKEIRKMTDMYKKQNINFIETLFTDYYILNPSYEHIFKEYFINKREEIAYYDMSKAIISSGYQALSTLDVKNPSGKVFVNAVRLLRFFHKYKRKLPYKDCIYYEEGTERDTLLKFKEVEVFDNIEILDNLKTDFRKHIKEAELNPYPKNETVEKYLFEGTKELIKKRLLLDF